MEKDIEKNLPRLSKAEVVQILKLVTSWNSGKIEFDRELLDHMDTFLLQIEKTEDTITLKTHFKK